MCIVQCSWLMHLLHFHDEDINIVSGIARIKVKLVCLHLLADEGDNIPIEGKYLVVRAWQVLHDCRDCQIQLQGENR